MKVIRGARGQQLWFVDRLLPLILVGVVVVRIAAVPPSAPVLAAPPGLVRGSLLLLAVATAVGQQFGGRPLIGLGLANLLGVSATLLGYPGPGAALPIAWSLFVVARQSDYRQTWWSTVASLVLTSLAGAASVFQGDGLPQALVAGLSLALASSIGLGVRARRELESSMRDRAERAEATREEEAKRRVAEDRLRIARELHDVIAHHLAIINVQSAVAGRLLPADPIGATAALGHIRTSSQAVLSELGSVLQVLRAGAAPLTPTAQVRVSLPGLGGLIDSFAASGTEVTYELPEVSSRRTTADQEVAVYRVVQEALTNAHRHAPGSAVSVSVRETDTEIQVRVSNEASALAQRPSTDGSGLGLVGLQERVTALSGSFEAGPTSGGGFAVSASLPLAPQTEALPEDRAEEGG